jgi:hypothetical protein
MVLINVVARIWDAAAGCPATYRQNINSNHSNDVTPSTSWTRTRSSMLALSDRMTCGMNRGYDAESTRSEAKINEERRCRVRVSVSAMIYSRPSKTLLIADHDSN